MAPDISPQRIIDQAKGLLKAIKSGDADHLRKIIDEGFTNPWWGVRALVLAVSLEQYDVIKILLDSGVDSNARSNFIHTDWDKIGSLLVEQECSDNHDELDFRWLNESFDENLEPLNTFFHTALDEAARNNNRDMVDFLIGQGATLEDEFSINGHSAMVVYKAAVEGNYDMVKYLVMKHPWLNGDDIWDALDSFYGNYDDKIHLKKFLAVHGANLLYAEENCEGNEELLSIMRMQDYPDKIEIRVDQWLHYLTNASVYRLLSSAIQAGLASLTKDDLDRELNKKHISNKPFLV